jgi:hypothetical protein
MKKLLSEVGEFWAGLWFVLKELAYSRKAVLVALASALSLLVVAIPDLAKYQDVVYTKIDVFLGLLVILIGLIDTFEAKSAGTVG